MIEAPVLGELRRLRPEVTVAEPPPLPEGGEPPSSLEAPLPLSR
jgi:hypothetical protein